MQQLFSHLLIFVFTPDIANYSNDTIVTVVEMLIECFRISVYAYIICFLNNQSNVCKNNYLIGPIDKFLLCEK